MRNQRQDDWQTVDHLPPPQPNELQLWRIDINRADSLLESCARLLSPAEQDRAARRIAGQVRNQFVLGRACLRILLGTALDLAPQAVSFTENPYGKPETPGVSFNVAHSRDTILIALRRDGPVGVDIEWINPAFDAMEIAQSAFHPDEIAQLVSILDADGQRRAFYALWTRKEALAKADGRGLSLPLHSFAVPLHPAANVPIALPASGRPPHGPPQTLFLNDIRVGDHFAAALALNAPDCRLSLLDFPIAAALAAF